MTSAKHLALVEKALHRINNGSLKRLIVTMPPQHGKSNLISVFFPLWYLGNNPNKRIILASYGYDLAKGFVRKVRGFFTEKAGAIFNLNLDIVKENEITIKQNSGYLYGTGFGGVITGKSADLLIIDDPIKNSEEANSKVYRDKSWEYYQTTLLTRVQSDGAIILIMTRWHSDDLVGRLLKTNENWEVINLPAIAKDNDLLGRQVGEPLWEKRFGIEQLMQRKDSLGSYFFSSLYQQEPIANEYVIFNPNWWRYWDELPKLTGVYQIWDTAFKVNEKNDYSVCVTMGFSGNSIYVLDVFRRKMTFPDLERKLVDKFNEFKPDWVLIEDAGSGQSLIQSFKEVKYTHNMHIKGIKASNKVTRAHSVSALVEKGQVYLKKGADWVESFINELAEFPQGKNDDQVDGFTFGAEELKSKLAVTFDYGLLTSSADYSEENEFTKGF